MVNPVCRLCNKEIKTSYTYYNKEVDDYTHIKDYKKGKKVADCYYHIKCYLDRLNKNLAVENNALKKASYMLDHLGKTLGIPTEDKEEVAIIK